MPNKNKTGSQDKLKQFFQFSAGLVIGLGVWTSTSKDECNQFIAPLFIVIGVVTFVICLIGLVGALISNPILRRIYLIILGLLFIWFLVVTVAGLLGVVTLLSMPHTTICTLNQLLLTKIADFTATLRLSSASIVTLATGVAQSLRHNWSLFSLIDGGPILLLLGVLIAFVCKTIEKAEKAHLKRAHVFADEMLQGQIQNGHI